jgi:hypothetical protein
VNHAGNGFSARCHFAESCLLRSVLTFAGQLLSRTLAVGGPPCRRSGIFHQKFVFQLSERPELARNAQFTWLSPSIQIRHIRFVLRYACGANRFKGTRDDLNCFIFFRFGRLFALFDHLDSSQSSVCRGFSLRGWGGIKTLASSVILLMGSGKTDYRVGHSVIPSFTFQS